MTKFTTKFAFIATAFAALASGNAALAETAPTRSIDVSAYDLSSPAQVQTVKSKIRRAAYAVCGLGDYDGTSVRAKKQECFKAAVAKGNSQIETALAYQSAHKTERTALSTSVGNRTIR